MNIFILLALVLGASASREHEGHEHSGPRPMKCCFGMTANCLACSEGMTEERYCAINPDTSGCKTEVELSCCRAYTAQCMACVAGITIEEYCHFKPHSFGCQTEVELSALDTLEAPLANNRCCNEQKANCLGCKVGMSARTYCDALKKQIPASMAYILKNIGCIPAERCCNDDKAQCLACKSGVTVKNYCDAMNFPADEWVAMNCPYAECCSYGRCWACSEVELSALDTLESPLARTYCDENPNTSRCIKQKERYCKRNRFQMRFSKTLGAYCTGMTEERYCAENPDNFDCKTEVELSAVDLLFFSRRYCAENPHFPDCKTEVELSAVDHLEVPLASILHKQKKRCCNGNTARCSACKAGVSKKVYCDAMKRFAFMGTIKGC